MSNQINDILEAEKTDDDQDILDYDDDQNNYELSGQDGNKSVREQREEIINELNNDLFTLEQLREQKNLLRSIRLRKEELKALEGRRKALEALKKIAVDGEKELDQAFDVLKTNNKGPLIDQDQNVNFLDDAEEGNNNNQKRLQNFTEFLDMLKEKQVIYGCSISKTELLVIF